MRYVKIKDLKPGYTVARNLYSMDNKILVAKNVALDSFNINKLDILNFKGIYIHDELTKDIIIADLIEETMKASIINDLKQLETLLIKFGKIHFDAYNQQNKNYTSSKDFINTNSSIIKCIDSIISNSKKLAQSIFYNKEFSFDLFDLQGEGDNVFTNSIAATELALLVGKKMNMKIDELEELAFETIFHDFGKLATNEDVLRGISINRHSIELLHIDAMELLNDRRKYHSFYSFSIASMNPKISSSSKNIILYHSERNDGNGPFQKNTDSIPIHSKLISVADEYVDVISGKYIDYKEGKKITAYCSPQEAREKLMTLLGTKFDEGILQLFLNLIPPYPKGTTVLLSNGSYGVVKENHTGGQISRPIIILENGKEIDLASHLNVTVSDSLIKEDLDIKSKKI